MNIYIYDNDKVSQRSIANNIPKKISNLTKKLENINFDNKDIIVLADTNFNFFSQNLSFYQKDKFTILDFKKILTHVKQDLKWKIDLNVNSNNYIIDNIYSNNEKQKDVFWLSWNISFDINILSPHHIYPIKSLPKNLWIIKHIHRTQKKDNFVILYINDKNTQLINVKKWFYENISELNLWINQLKIDMIEDNILQYMYDNNIANIVTQRILTEKYTYFTKLLSNWLKNNIRDWKDIYIYSKLSKSEIFMNIMKNNLTKLWWWYILPLNHILTKEYQDNIYISSMILSWLI